MAKRCTKCGNFMMDDERFCPNCGENAQNSIPSSLQGAPVPQPEPVNNTYQQNYQQPAYQQPYNVPRPADDKDIMTLGKWVGTLVVTTFFGIISLIFTFIWAFGDGPEARRRFCKAYLIVKAISIGLAIIIMAVYFAIFASLISSYMDRAGDIDWSEFEQQFTAVKMMLGF